jgi:NAD(P)-dependent dehydrogenase (short-subunit alcohol dehydrogenase family)
MMASAMTSTSSQHKLPLQGKRVLVTGGGRGIGRAIALICHRQGAQVAIASRTRSELQETIDLSSSSNDECISSIQLYEADVTNVQSVESMVQEIRDKWGGLDILINNAGGAQKSKGPMDTLDSQNLQSLLQLNVVGPQIVTSAVLKYAMPKDGKIVNISSKAGKVGLPNYSFYVASKFALEGMTACWAKELLDRNILVHSMSPGMIDTQSFPKPAGKPGVRSADSVEDCLIMALTASKEYTGHYVHVDELDVVRNAKLPDTAAWKVIDEAPFSVQKTD